MCRPGTYHQLGTVAQEQRKWEQAQAYYLIALETYVAYNDDYTRNIIRKECYPAVAV